MATEPGPTKKRRTRRSLVRTARGLSRALTGIEPLPSPSPPRQVEAGLDLLDQGIAIFDRDLRLTYCNRHFGHCAPIRWSCAGLEHRSPISSALMQVRVITVPA